MNDANLLSKEGNPSMDRKSSIGDNLVPESDPSPDQNNANHPNFTTDDNSSTGSSKPHDY